MAKGSSINGNGGKNGGNDSYTITEKHWFVKLRKVNIQTRTFTSAMVWSTPETIQITISLTTLTNNIVKRLRAELCP